MPLAAPTSKSLIFVFLTVLLSMIGLGIIMPVMPALIMELTGTNVSGAAALGGYLLLVYAAMQFVMSPILGALSDRYGRRPVILISLLASSVDLAFMALAPTYAWLFVGRMIAGATAAVFATANAYIADVSTPEKRAANFGLMGAAFGLGFIFGPIIGGIFGEIGPRWPFIAASALGFLNFLYGLVVLPETLSEENRRRFDWRRANPFGGLASMARYPVVIGVLSAYFLMQLAHNSLPAVWAYFSKLKFGWSEAQIGLSLAFVGFTAAIVQGGLTRVIIPKIGETRSVVLGMAAMVASLLGYAFFTPTGNYVYLWIVVGALGGFMMPGMQGIMSRATPPNEQGELQGAIASLMSITMMVSPFTMTQIFAYFTDTEEGRNFPGAPYAVGAGLIVISAIPFILTMRKVPSRDAADRETPAPEKAPT